MTKFAKEAEVKRNVKRLDVDPAGWKTANAYKGAYPLFFFGNDAGGVGKSLDVHMMAIMLLDNKVPFKLVECETSKRISPLFPDISFFHEFDEEKLDDDADASNRYWDALGRQCSRGEITLVDLTANGVKSLLRWANTESGKIYYGKGAGMNFLCPTTSESKSLNAATRNLAGWHRAFPEARLYLLVNPMRARLTADSVEIKLVRETVGEAVTVVELPVCTAPAWGAIENLGRYDEVAALGVEKLEERGIDAGVAQRSLTRLHRFGIDMAVVLREVGRAAGLAIKPEHRPEQRAMTA